MSWGFEIDRIYNRRGDIHRRFGGQQQGGIITPAQHPLVIVITGHEGRQHGYSDRYRDDGVFEYFGEGQVGDMEWVRGNRMILFHSASGRALLLFRKERAGLRFLGEMVYAAHRIERAPDRNGNDRNAIVFELRPLAAVNQAASDLSTPSPEESNLDQLRDLAYAAAGFESSTRISNRTIYQRSADIRNYVLCRSGGFCEGCGQPAPFKKPDGAPYLEPHHIRRLSDGGPDHPAFVIALCPTCHRRVHFGIDGSEKNAAYLATMDRIERR